MNTENFEDQMNQGEDSGFEALPDTGDATEQAYIATETRKPISRGTIGVALILIVGVFGLYKMNQRGGPQSAAAADPKAQQVIKQFMSDRDRNQAAMQRMLRDTDAVVKQFMNYPSVSQIPLSDLKTNPFRVAPADTETPTLSRRDEERDKKRREEERASVIRSAQALQLQFVFFSDARKACMINNTQYTEGQQVGTFTIEKISPNSIVVRSGIYRFELRMQR